MLDFLVHEYGHAFLPRRISSYPLERSSRWRRGSRVAPTAKSADAPREASSGKHIDMSELIGLAHKDRTLRPSAQPAIGERRASHRGPGREVLSP